MIPSPEHIKAVNEMINSRGFIGSLAMVIVGVVIWQLSTGALEFSRTIPSKLDTVVSSLQTVVVKLDSCFSHNGERTASR